VAFSLEMDSSFPGQDRWQCSTGSGIKEIKIKLVF